MATMAAIDSLITRAYNAEHNLETYATHHGINTKNIGPETEPADTFEDEWISLLVEAEIAAEDVVMQLADIENLDHDAYWLAIINTRRYLQHIGRDDLDLEQLILAMYQVNL